MSRWRRNVQGALAAAFAFPACAWGCNAISGVDAFSFDGGSTSGAGGHPGHTTWSHASSGGAGGSDSGCSTSPSPCADAGKSCVTCAQQGPCKTLVDECKDAAECSSFVTCTGQCDADPACLDDCTTTHEAGAVDFVPILGCTFCTCPCELADGGCTNGGGDAGP